MNTTLEIIIVGATKMKVKEALEQLSKLPPDAELMVASMGAGGSVSVLGFTKVDEQWVDVDFDEYE